MHHAGEQQRHELPRHGQVQRIEVVLGVRLRVVLADADPVVTGQLANALVVVPGLVWSGSLFGSDSGLWEISAAWIAIGRDEVRR